ncbi:large ribosomal subunit protein mL55-like isoform X2 [Ruditapes philippinarum]|uniref:large ribosomal subunit protein mL55-like isoform X2 n=1 Tax=Ruditapes philippinarum TaxID=129788 RepID=UPI00295AD7CD|nr:large ribosomal subunit protein mL55-like isoform X2 [Ruditapes philippinarum]
MQASLPLRQTTCCVCPKLSSIRNERYNCNRASICREKKHGYLRTYPALLVFPDGSSVNIRYEKPRNIIVLPVDVSKLTEKEKEARNLKFNPPKKTEIKEDLDDDFDTNKYTSMFKKNKKSKKK